MTHSQLTPLTCPSHLSKQRIVAGRTSSGRRASSSSRTASASTSASSAFEKAYEVWGDDSDSGGGSFVRIGEVPFAKKSVKELAAQGSYGSSGDRGLLGSLVSSKRDAPLTRRLRHGAEQEGIYQRRRLGQSSSTCIATRRQPCSAARGSSATRSSNGPMRSLRGWARRCATAARSRRWR